MNTVNIFFFLSDEYKNNLRKYSLYTDSVITARNGTNSFDSVPSAESIVINAPTTSKELFRTARDKPSPTQTLTSPPTITITSSDDEKSIDGMLDRISHDLDYLLNRTADMPTQI